MMAREVILRSAPLLALLALILAVTVLGSVADTVTARRVILCLVNVVAVVECLITKTRYFHRL